jgi:hypothetical protein
MILLARPVRIYDVDLVGGVMVAMISIAAFVLVVRPTFEGDELGHQARQAVALAEASIDRTTGRLEQTTRDLKALSTAVDLRAVAAPNARDSAGFPSAVAGAADAVGARIVQMAPIAARETERGLVSDLQVTARGSVLDLARLLDRLRRDRSHHQILEYSVLETRDPADARCTLTFTVRLFLAASAAGDKS